MFEAGCNMDKAECYRILGVAHGAARTEVKRAFRRLALLFSPDRHPGDEDALARYREIVAAYQMLNTPEDPRQRELDSAEEKPRVRGFKSFRDVVSAFDEPDDVRCEARLRPKEALAGCERRAMIRRFQVCDACQGRGGESPCGKCRGVGKMWEEVEVRLRVPAGVKDGALLRLRGEGDLTRADGVRGDIYCRVRVE